MAWELYDGVKETALAGGLNLDTGGDSLKVMLTSVEPTPAHVNRDSVTGEVAAGSSYTAGGAAVVNQAVTTSGTTGATSAKFDMNDITWIQDAGTGFSNASYAILYKAVGTPATDVLVAYAAFSSAKSIVDGDFTLEMDATNGVFTFSGG